MDIIRLKIMRKNQPDIIPKYPLDCGVTFEARF